MSEIAIDEVISRVKAHFNIADASEDMFFEMNINEAVRQLDSLSIFSPCQVDLVIENMQAQLPCDFYKLVAAKVTCNDDTDIYSRMFYVDLDFMRTCGCDTNDSDLQSYLQLFKIIGNTLYLASSASSSITSVTMAYWGLRKNDDGLMVIEEDYERALWNYAAWQYCLKYYDVPRFRGACSTYERIWNAQRKWIRGRDQQLRFERDRFWLFNTVYNRVFISWR